MARITSFIYCVNAERVPNANGKGDTINALGILSAMTPEFVPGTFSFSIIFSILDMDILKENTIQIIFSKEGEDVALVDTKTITIPAMPDDNEGVGLPEEHRGLNMSMDFRNVVFEEEGVYNTTVYFNGELLGVNPIYVKGKR